ncbi:monooxygenase [Pinisolibacter aquiterrae]|uniref:monooxygenase n=1 Tax=Pinisolibacter aquiterrae TaxID=2815579 RepID=UPI001C3D0E76|nr:monooxygenase [Pinisolibacter aquiterrae]MBV5266023.1 monooxygenase [Pinisolibacter aquiterrae]MCC8237120.1 monooxygenase [Pinisolibacter aquiterrae]
MILTLVRFRLDDPMTLEEAARRFALSAPKYLDLPGLVRKHYVRSDDGLTVGGVYLWKTRAAAEDCYAGEWRERVRILYGVEPEIEWFETPVGVDNVLGTII